MSPDPTEIQHAREVIIKLNWRPYFTNDGTWDGEHIQTPDHCMTFGRWHSTAIAMRELVAEGHQFPPAPAIVEAALPQKRKRRAKRPSGACYVEGCDRTGTQFHHVTYHPVAGYKLCSDHHKEITVVNTNQAERMRHKLSNKHRWWAWSQWLKGELKPVFTADALEYLKSWKD